MAKRRWVRRKRTETSVEVHQVLIVKRQGASVWLTCEECLGGQMLAPEEASVILKVPNRTIYQWVEAGLVHCVETPDTSLLVCMVSLRTVATKLFN